MSSRWHFVRPRYLFSDLERRSTLEDALVVLAIEFGRTPVINANGGRDHHPQAYSCMLAGGGINGGQVWGKTDERGSKILEGKVRVEDFIMPLLATRWGCRSISFSIRQVRDHSPWRTKASRWWRSLDRTSSYSRHLCHERPGRSARNVRTCWFSTSVM